MKRKKRRTRRPFRRKTRANDQLLRDLDHAYDLLDQQRYDEVIELLEPYAKQGVKDFRLHTILGIAYAYVGEIFLAIEQFESACALQKDSSAAGTLGELYAMAGMPVLALDAFRKAKKWGADIENMPGLKERMAAWREEIQQTASDLNISESQAEKAVKLKEQAELAIQRQNFAKGARLFQEARRLLGDYPPLLNNFSLALFYHGEREQAEELAREVLAKAPDNIAALGNLMRFIVMAGREEEARGIWRRLQAIEPDNSIALLKKAEAAALLDEDQAVYDLLHPHIDDLDAPPELVRLAMRYLGVAAANLGKRTEAMGWFRELKPHAPMADILLEALKQGKSGLGIAERYYYLGDEELLPAPAFAELTNLIVEESSLAPEVFQRRMNTFLQRFPQTHLLAKRLLLEQENRMDAIDLLATLGTPEAHAILKEFALGRKGSKEDRLYALRILVEAGVFPPGTTIQFWDDEGVKPLEVRQTILDPAHFQQYDIVVFDLLEEAYKALEEGRHEDAREAFQRALEHNPQVKEAYNNLSTFAMQEGRVHEAKALLYKALEIDPDYLFARTNLAQIFLEEGRIDKAEAVLEPVAHRADYHPSEVAALASAQARILIEKAEYVRAEALLQRALEAYPEHILAQRELDRLERMYFPDRSLEEKTQLRKMWKKDALRYRKRQQKKLANPHPTVAEALGVYTKDQLKAMGWHIAPEGGWSQLRKQELLDLLVERMKQPETLERLLDSLTPYERKAFSDVLAHVMDWDAFNDAYGNDFIDSPYWEYHEPQSPMGRLRIRGLIVEALDGDRLVISIPVELREMAKT